MNVCAKAHSCSPKMENANVLLVKFKMASQNVSLALILIASNALVLIKVHAMYVKKLMSLNMMKMLKK